MIDPSEMETAAIQACLIPLGDFVATIGVNKPLADYTKDEVLLLIDAVITAYQDHMVMEHERIAAMDRAMFEERIAKQKNESAKGVPF